MLFSIVLFIPTYFKVQPQISSATSILPHDESDGVPPQQAEDPVAPMALGRGARQKRPTWKVLERLPQPPIAIPESEPVATKENDHVEECATATTWDRIWKPVHIVHHAFGLYREFPTVPSHDPDDMLTLQDLAESQPPPSACDPPTSTSARLSFPPVTEVPSTPEAINYPEMPVSVGLGSWFPNSTVFGIMNWMWTGSVMKSVGEMRKLIDFLKSDDFKKEDLHDFDIAKETAKLDKALTGNSETSLSKGQDDAWVESDVVIQVPDGKPHDDDSDVPTYTFSGLHHRSLAAVVKSVFEDPASRYFHYTPFKQFWKPSPTEPPQRVYDEVYSSDAMIEAHINLLQSPPEPCCDLERVIAAMMYWSDSTHLATFGSASLWPLYLFFGNQSKWVRGKPRSASCHHVAYIPKVRTLSSA